MTDLTVGRVIPAVTIDVPMPKCAPPRSDALEFRIGRMALGPDDVLVIKVDAFITEMAAGRIRATAQRAIGSDARILILEKGVDLSVLTRAEIEARSDDGDPLLYCGKLLSELTHDEREGAKAFATKCLADFSDVPSNRRVRENARKILGALQ